MASNLTFSSVQSGRPRTMSVLSDIAAIRARCKTGAWKAIYDSKIYPWAVGSGYTTAHTDAYTMHLKVLTCIVAGIAEDVQDFYGRAWTIAANCAGAYGSSSNPNTRRTRILGCAWAVDFYQYASIRFGFPISSATMKLIGDWLYSRITELYHSPSELMDGHAAGDHTARLVGSLALHGLKSVPGGYDYTDTGPRDVGPELEKALEFWYGGNPSYTDDGLARFDADRYYGASGGGWKGGWYQMLSNWYSNLVLLHVDNGLVGKELGGDSYSIAEESFFGKTWRWTLLTALRGDHDYLQMGDTPRVTNPFFGNYERGTVAPLCRWGEDSTAIAIGRAIYELMNAEAVRRGQDAAYFYAPDIMLFDRAIAPANLSAVASDVYFLDPPGLFQFRSRYDNTPDQVIFQIRIPQFVYLGHPTLNRGEIQCSFGADMVLTQTGTYSTTPADGPSDFGGTHTNNWRGQSISHSGIVLVDDGAVTPHTNYNEVGGVQSYPSGLGGQYWKRYNDGLVDHRDPKNTTYMRSHDGGEAWRACESLADPSKAGKLLVNDSEIAVLSSSLRKAYLLRSAHLGTSSERVTAYDAKWMVIKQFSPTGRSALLGVHRVVSRLSSMSKRVCWHFFNTPNVTTDPVLNAIRIFGTSRGATQQFFPELVGTQGMLVDFLGAADWTVQTIGGGTSNPYTPGAFDYSYGGVNYAPSPTNNERDLDDIGRCRAEVRPKSVATEHFFVWLLTPLRSNEALPTYRWIIEDNYFGIEAGGKVYKLHKTQDIYVGPTGAIDVEAPAKVQNLSGSSPESQAAQLLWDPNTELDLAKYRVYKRLKV